MFVDEIDLGVRILQCFVWFLEANCSQQFLFLFFWIAAAALRFQLLVQESVPQPTGQPFARRVMYLPLASLRG